MQKMSGRKLDLKFISEEVKKAFAEYMDEVRNGVKYPTDWVDRLFERLEDENEI